MLNIAEPIPPSESVPNNSWNHFPPDSIYSQNQFQSILSTDSFFEVIKKRINSNQNLMFTIHRYSRILITLDF
jgi:hypothetical protein